MTTLRRVMRNPLAKVMVIAIATIGTMLSAPKTASAQATDRERAEAHFEVARRHVQEGRCDLAIEELRLSIDYEPTSVGARLNLGDCYVLLGQLPEAFRFYEEAEANAVSRNDARVDAARRAAAQVASKLVRVLLREPEPAVPGVVLTVDGVSSGTRPWTVAVTPDQRHVVEAKAPDGGVWHSEVRGQAGDTVRLVLNLVAPSPAGPRGGASGTSSARGAVALAAVAVGTAGVATGIVFSALAAGSRSDLADAVNADPSCKGTYPDARCDRSAEGRLGAIQNRAYAQSTVATVGLITGGVLLAGGIMMWLFAPKSAAKVAGEVRAGGTATWGLSGSF